MAEKTYPIVAPDGSKFNITGPDDATKDQIAAAAKVAWEKITTTPKVTSVATVKPTVKPTGPTNDTFTQGQNAPAKMEDSSYGLGQAFLDVSKNALMGRPGGMLDAGRKYLNTSTNDKLADLGGIVRTGAATALGAAVGEASGSPLVASAGMAATDQALRKETGQKTGSTLFPDNPAAAMVSGTLENEIIGSVVPLVSRLAGLAGKTQIGNRTIELLKLKPTLGQLSTKEGIENLFARASKVASVQGSTDLAAQGIKDEVFNITGKRASTETLSLLHQAEVDSAFTNFVKASNKEATDAIAGADLFPHQLPATVTQTTSQVPNIVGGIQVGTKAVSTPQVIPGKTINGPILQSRAITLLTDIRKELIPTYVSPDPDTPVANAIRGLFKDMNAEFDPVTGDLTKYDPVSFETAWKHKQIIDKLGYGDKVENLNFTDSRFRNISAALNQDIDSGIYKWSKDPSALPQLNDIANSWRKAKAIVSVRHALFNPEGETGQGVKTLLNTVNAPDDASNAIMYDHMKLNRFLKTGDYKIGNTVITSNNARKDMQGYALQKIFNDNWKSNDILLGTGVADGEKMANDFTDYAGSKTGQQLFSKAQIRQYSDMFDAIRRVTKAPTTGLSKYLAFNFATKSASLGIPLLAGSLTLGSGAAATIAGGELSLYGVARVMTNEKAAPLWNALLHNRPLGMSFQSASRAMVQALSGQRITLNMLDGSKQESIVGTDGKIRPVN